MTAAETLEKYKLALETLERFTWIPVTDRLPEGDEMVLVTAKAKNGHRSVNRAYHNEMGWHGSGSMSGVTAWMPMPEPYNEEENDGH